MIQLIQPCDCMGCTQGGFAGPLKVVLEARTRRHLRLGELIQRHIAAGRMVTIQSLKADFPAVGFRIHREQCDLTYDQQQEAEKMLADFHSDRADRRAREFFRVSGV